MGLDGSWVKQGCFNPFHSDFYHLEFIMNLSTRVNVLHEVVLWSLIYAATSRPNSRGRGIQRSTGSQLL